MYTTEYLKKRRRHHSSTSESPSSHSAEEGRRRRSKKHKSHSKAHAIAVGTRSITSVTRESGSWKLMRMGHLVQYCELLLNEDNNVEGRPGGGDQDLNGNQDRPIPGAYFYVPSKKTVIRGEIVCDPALG